MRSLNKSILLLLLITIGSTPGCGPSNTESPAVHGDVDNRISSGPDDSNQNLVENPGFEIIDSSTGLPEGWHIKTQRQEIAPSFEIDSSVSHTGEYSAFITSKGSYGTFGYWMARINGVQPEDEIENFTISRKPVRDSDFLSNRRYLISCYFKAINIESPEKNIWIRANWINEEGRSICTEFILPYRKEGDWYRVEQLVTTPKAAASLELELALQWTESGKVWWDDVSVVESSVPEHKRIRVAAICVRPENKSTPEKNRKFYADKIIEAGKLGADLFCLGEGITIVSTDKKYDEVAEQVPGPTSKILGEAARKAGLYVVAGIYEREGELIYNTALLIDRNGKIAGKYRKTHLPETEVYGGITPGTEYPVFLTDFGTVGIEICYDNFFPEVTASLALKGADIILLPIWGDIRENGNNWDIVARARAIDNAVYLVASMYDNRSLIISPYGQILADGDDGRDIITAEIDLDLRTFEPWLSVHGMGEWKRLYPKERRLETYKGLVESFYDK